jgi:DNA-binding transcriptional MerR regulator
MSFDEVSTDESFSVESSENSGTDSLATTETGGGDSGFNEAWKPLLDVLPEGMHPLIKEPLTQWDQNYQKLQEEYKPFKELPDAYRNPERITQAMTVLGNLEANPHQVLKLLAENLGVSLAEAQEIVEEQQEQEEELEFSEDDDPRLVALAKQIQQEREERKAFIQQQVEREEQRLIAEEAKVQGAAIDDQVRGIINAGHYGATKEQQAPLLQDLMLRADYAFKQGSKDPIGDAFKAQQAVFGVVAQRVAPQAQKPNLLFMPASSGAAPENVGKGPNLDTEQGRAEAARHVMEMLARQG